jgi:hypothetical protein
VSLTSKSPNAVALAGLATARRALPAYSHLCSPKTFTQHQLFACLALKNFLRTDYRGVVAYLGDSPALVKTLGLTKLPHFTTLQKAAKRLLLSTPARRLLEATVRLHMGRRRRVKRAAIDSTGMECSAASGYFVRRRARVAEPWKTVVYHRFPKLGVVCDSDNHFILACRVGRGPRPDVDEFRPLLDEALRIGGCLNWRPTPAMTPNPITALLAMATAYGRSSLPSTADPRSSRRRAVTAAS